MLAWRTHRDRRACVHRCYGNGQTLAKTFTSDFNQDTLAVCVGITVTVHLIDQSFVAGHRAIARVARVVVPDQSASCPSARQWPRAVPWSERQLNALSP
jgi:hypothetical protein